MEAKKVGNWEGEEEIELPSVAILKKRRSDTVKIKKFLGKRFWRILVVLDLIEIWLILHMTLYIDRVDLDCFRCGGSWATPVWKFIGEGIHRTATQGAHFHLDIDFLLPLYLLGFAIFVLGIFIVKAWQEQKKEMIKSEE